MSNIGAQGAKLVFAGGINRPIPITIRTKHFGKRRKLRRKSRRRSRRRRSRKTNKRRRSHT
jgi:hypothetical protein